MDIVEDQDDTDYAVLGDSEQSGSGPIQNAEEKLESKTAKLRMTSRAPRDTWLNEGRRDGQEKWGQAYVKDRMDDNVSTA